MTRPSILILGGGLIGLSIAEHLLRRGVRATVLERGQLAREASWASSGFLDLRVAAERAQGLLQLTRHSLELYPEWVKRLERDSGVDPELLHSSSLDLAFDIEELARLEALGQRLHQKNIQSRLLDGEALHRLEPRLSRDVVGGLYLEHPLQVRPPRLNRALAETLRRGGVTLEEQTEVLDFEAREGRIHTVHTTRGPRTADRVVLAAGPWSGPLAQRLGLLLPTRPVRGQAVLYGDRPGASSHLLFGTDWYIVPRRDGKTYVGSTLEDVGFDKNTTPPGIAHLRAIARRVLPALDTCPVEGSWAGLRPGTHDGLPYLGRPAEWLNLWIASGHFTHGVALAPITGELLARDLLAPGSMVELAPFSPSRVGEQPIPAKDLSFAVGGR